MKVFLLKEKWRLFQSVPKFSVKPKMGKCNPVTRIIPASFAWIVLLFSTGIFFAFPCWYLMLVYSIGIPVFQSIITFFVIVNFSLATFVNPGVIPKAASDELKGDGIGSPAFQEIEIRGVRVRLKWCVTCQFYRPPRCVHCGVCNTCIETFDHHCPWVNNCIGRRNYRYFFMFLFWLSIHMVSILTFCALYLKDHMNNLKQLETIMTLVIVGIIIILFIPILGLTAYHMMLIMQGRTTNEQVWSPRTFALILFTSNAYLVFAVPNISVTCVITISKVTGKFLDGQSPYTRGCCKNIMYSLCSSPLPRYKKGNSLYTSVKQCSGRNLTEQPAVTDSESKNSEKTSSVHFKFVDQADYMLPKQSQSDDCEESPPSYLNRGRLHLSLSESLYAKHPDTSVKNRGSCALTPPVPIRFDCSRRSLPPHNRLHAPSPHYVVAQSVHGTVFHTQKDISKVGACASGHSSNSTLYYSQNQNPALDKYDYGTSSADGCGASSNFYSYLYKRKDIMAKEEGLSFTSPESSSSSKALTSDTCCLGNQTVDKLQELANRTMISGQCTEVSVLEAFPKGCGSFHNSPSKECHDVHQLLIAQTPQQLFVNNCVDCQQSSSNHSCQSSVSGEFVRTPGNRPLSFVKAMEMSETLEWSANNLQQYNISENALHYKMPHDLSSNYKLQSPNSSTLQDNKGQKKDHEISYEISV